MAEGERPTGSPRVAPRTTRGLGGLAAERASALAVERVRREHPGLTGLSFSMQVATDLQTHLRDDVAEGMRFAREAVAAVRAAPDYDPAVHGSSDDEVAAYIQGVADAARRLARQAAKG